MEAILALQPRTTSVSELGGGLSLEQLAMLRAEEVETWPTQRQVRVVMS